MAYNNNLGTIKVLLREASTYPKSCDMRARVGR